MANSSSGLPEGRVAGQLATGVRSGARTSAASFQGPRPLALSAAPFMLPSVIDGVRVSIEGRLAPLAPALGEDGLADGLFGLSPGPGLLRPPFLGGIPARRERWRRP